MNCGTEKGLLQHKARNEPPCKWCIKFRDDPAPKVKTPRATSSNRPKKQRAPDYKRPRAAQVTGEIRHGTPWGYKQHTSRGEKACPPCSAAAAKKRKEYQAKNAANQ